MYFSLIRFVFFFKTFTNRNLEQPTLNITGHTNTNTGNNQEYAHIKENGYQYENVDIKANSFTSKLLNGEQQQFSSAGSVNNTSNSSTKNIIKDCNKSSGVSSDLCICKNLYNNKNLKNNNMDSNNRDRLGQWGTVSDAETPGNISGLDRIRNGRYNKVSESEILLFFPCTKKSYLYNNNKGQGQTIYKVNMSQLLLNKLFCDFTNVVKFKHK